MRPEELLPSRKRTLLQRLADMQSGIPSEAPEEVGAQAPMGQDLPGPLPQGPDQSVFQPAPRPKLSDILQGQLDKASAPPTKKGALLKAITQTGAIGLGGLLGGTTGAYGASQGVGQFNAEQAAQGTERRKELQTQLEAEKNREERNTERQIGAQVSANTLSEAVRKANQESADKAAAIAAENQRAAGVQAGENQRLDKTLAKPPAIPYELTPPGTEAKVGLETKLGQIPAKAPQPPALLPAANEAQRIRIAQASRPPAQDKNVVQVVDDPNNPGKQKLVVVDTTSLTQKDIAGDVAKTPTSQANAAAKDVQAFNDAQKSLNAMKDLAKRRTYIADQAMGDQFFNVVKPGTGARMNQAQIERFMTPGPMKNRMTAWAQKLDQGQPFTDADRQAMINAASDVMNSKAPKGSSAPSGGAWKVIEVK